MSTQELNDYIQKAREAKQSNEQIKENLLKSGWSIVDINSALGFAFPRIEAQPPYKTFMRVGLFSIFLNSMFVGLISGFLTLEGVQTQLLWNWVAALDHYDYLSLILIPVSISLFFVAPVFGIIYGYKLLSGGQIKNYVISYLIVALLLMAGLLFLGQFTLFLYYIVISIIIFFIFPELRQRSYVIISQININKQRKFLIIALVAGLAIGFLIFWAISYMAFPSNLTYLQERDFQCSDGGILMTSVYSKNVSLRTPLGSPVYVVGTIDDNLLYLNSNFNKGEKVEYLENCKDKDSQTIFNFYKIGGATTSKKVQDIKWWVQLGTNEWDYVGGDIAVDYLGDLYIAGSVGGALPGQAYSGGELDAFLQKYNSDGKIIWTKQFGAASNDGVDSVAVDISGNVVIGGYIGDDGFVRKYDSNGNELWSKNMDNPTTEIAITIDSAENIYATYTASTDSVTRSFYVGNTHFIRKYDFRGNVIWTKKSGKNYAVSELALDFQGNIYITGWLDDVLPDQTSSGSKDAFLKKYDSNGNELWARQFGTGGTDSAKSLAVDSLGNIYVVGELNGYRSFIRKYNSSGNVSWEKEIRCESFACANGIDIDFAGNIYVVGGARDEDEDDGDVFIQKYDLDGNVLFDKRLGTYGNDTGTDAAIDDRGNIYIVGHTNGSLPDQVYLGGITDLFIARLNSKNK